MLDNYILLNLLIYICKGIQPERWFDSKKKTLSEPQLPVSNLIDFFVHP